MAPRTRAEPYDWDDLFIRFAGMPKSKRTLKRLADETGTSYQAVKYQAIKDHWTKRAAELDREAVRTAEKKVVRDHAARMTLYLEIVDEYMDRAIKAVKSGEMSVKDPNALTGLLKLAMVHAGEATERVEIHEVREVLVAWLDVVLPLIPAEERGELVETLRERIGHHLPPELVAGA